MIWKVLISVLTIEFVFRTIKYGRYELNDLKQWVRNKK